MSNHFHDLTPNFQNVITQLQSYSQQQQHTTLSISDFIVGKTLGTGTFGKVKHIQWKKYPTYSFALKCLKKSTIIQLNQLQHIQSEKKILQRINHPYIVRLINTFQDDKYIYMILEYMAGGELFNRLRIEGRFSEDVTLYYSSQILCALRYLHQKDIVYRDLKPENLLINNKGHVKIVDFGFAKKLYKNRTYTLCGTPEYLAPEIIKGQRKGYGKSVDWWAFGILLYEMLVGYPPFYDKKPTGIYKKILKGVIKYPQHMNNITKDIIRLLLNPDIEYRIGCQDDGKSIMKHRYYNNVCFEDMLENKIEAPWIPKLKNKNDTQYFEQNNSKSIQHSQTNNNTNNSISANDIQQQKQQKYYKQYTQIQQKQCIYSEKEDEKIQKQQRQKQLQYCKENMKDKKQQQKQQQHYQQQQYDKYSKNEKYDKQFEGF